jgi:hypothetical protein
MILNKDFGKRLSPEEWEGIPTGAKDPKKHRNFSRNPKVYN